MQQCRGIPGQEGRKGLIGEQQGVEGLWDFQGVLEKEKSFEM